jgi:cytoskeletal protein CcmA (bactofilin family)
MFRKRTPTVTTAPPTIPVERITSVLGTGVNWKGQLGGSGGVRIEGTFEGDIILRGLLVVGETGRVTCENMRAHVVIVAGAVRGDITAEKVEIRHTGRVWGNVTTAAFATEEGAFLRGQIRMEEHIDIGLGESPTSEGSPEDTRSAGETG